MLVFLLSKGKPAIIRLLRRLAKEKKKEITTKAKEFFASAGIFDRIGKILLYTSIGSTGTKTQSWEAKKKKGVGESRATDSNKNQC